VEGRLTINELYRSTAASDGNRKSGFAVRILSGLWLLSNGIQQEL